MRWSKPRSIGVALSFGWFAMALLVVSHQRSVEILTDIRECHQLREAAGSNPRCAGSESHKEDLICAAKDADCEHWPLEEAVYRERIAEFAALPVAVGWLVAYVAARRRRRMTRETKVR